MWLHNVKQSTAPYKATLAAQLEWLNRKPGQMELINVDGYFAVTGAPEPGKRYTTFLAAQQHLFSRGSIHVLFPDVTRPSKIQPNYFSVPFDIAVLTAGVKYLRKIGGTSAYANITIKEVVPGTSVVGSALEDSVTSLASLQNIAIGTASMLPRLPGGAVDPTLKVHGAQYVRVMDDSIIPLHLATHPRATIYGIAEKAVDIIFGRS